MALRLTQALTEMSTRNLPGGKAGLAHKADNSPPSVNQLSRKCGILDVSKPYRSPWPICFFLTDTLELSIKFS
jgi:hypothetical protein